LKNNIYTQAISKTIEDSNKKSNTFLKLKIRKIEWLEYSSIIYRKSWYSSRISMYSFSLNVSVLTLTSDLLCIILNCPLNIFSFNLLNLKSALSELKLIIKNIQNFIIPQEVINDRFALPHFGPKTQALKVPIMAMSSISSNNL